LAKTWICPYNLLAETLVGGQENTAESRKSKFLGGQGCFANIRCALDNSELKSVRRDLRILGVLSPPPSATTSRNYSGRYKSPPGSDKIISQLTSVYPLKIYIHQGQSSSNSETTCEATRTPNLLHLSYINGTAEGPGAHYCRPTAE
jgi:hypothetical protein